MSANATDVYNVNSLALYLGCAARFRFPNVRMLDVIVDLAEMYDSNPNTTLDDLAEYYGTTKSAMEVFQYIQFNSSMEDMRNGVLYARDIVPTLPHPQFYPAIIPLVVGFTVVGSVIMAARFYSRLSILGKIPFYDWLMLVGFMFVEAMMGVIIADAHTARNGNSTYDQTWTDIVYDCIFLDIRDVLYPASALIIKSSLLLFYYRLSPANAGVLKWVVIITFIISLGSAVPAAVVNLVYYGKVDWWNHLLDGTTNSNDWLDYPKEFMVTGALNILTDVIIWVIPIVLVWRPMQKRGRPERIATIMLFFLGAVVCVTGALRIATFWELTTENSTGPLASVPISVWSIIEVQLAIICASVPALRALMVKYFPKFWGLRNSVIVGSIVRPSRSRVSQPRCYDETDWEEPDIKRPNSIIIRSAILSKHNSSSHESKSTANDSDESWRGSV